MMSLALESYVSDNQFHNADDIRNPVLCFALLYINLKNCLAKADRRFVCLFGFLTSSSTTRLYRGRAPRQERLTILRAATHETELGDHDFCLSRSHYTDTDPTCRERAATAGADRRGEEIINYSFEDLNLNTSHTSGDFV